MTDETFERDVIARSAQVPVVVDLWAEWCGPCRTLGPILEKVIDETDGQVALVKVNVDTSPGVAAAFQVQSIPAVYAIRDGKVEDSFIGAQPEARVREFVDKLAPSATEADLLAGRGDEASLRAALELDPAHEKAVVGLAELLVGRGEPDEALGLLARIPESNDTRRVSALARVGPAAAADHHNGAEGGVEHRLDALLERVKGDNDARQEFVDLLELLGPDDPRTSQYRRSLMSRLY